LTAGVARGEEANASGDSHAKARSDLKVKGRVFAREETTTLRVAGERQWRHEQRVDSARVGIDYRRASYLRVEVEADFAGGELDLKDAYVRVEPVDPLRVQAGRFKRPMSVIGLESKWELPSTERGLLASLEVDGQDLPFSGGRGEGVSLRFAPDVAAKPRFTAALMQNPLGAGTAGLDASENFAQDVYVRGEVRPVSDLTLASSAAVIAYLREVGNPDSFRHAPIVSLEARWDGDHVRTWAEGFIGRSPFAAVGAPARGTFWATRALVAPRIEREGWPKRIEPFVLASLFDPSSSGTGDRNSEIGGGINLGFTKFWRLQVDAAHRFAHGDRASAIEATVIRAQLGARFEE